MFEHDQQSIEDLRKLNLWRRYQSTLSFILYAATKSVLPGCRLRIEHSMSQGFYCYLDKKLSLRSLKRIALKMQNIINQDLRIQRFRCQKSSAIRLFKEQGQFDKVDLLKNCPIESIYLYKLQQLYDIYPMAPFESTGKSPVFRLIFLNPGFVLLFPSWQDLSKISIYIPQPRLSRIFNEYGEWVRILGVDDVADLNRAVKQGRGPEIIKVSEALHEKKIIFIADRITREKHKIVLIAGPSSAGKTTFTKRLAIQLLVNNLRPLLISADDYFYPHSKTPRDEYGRLDFESIKTVDISLLNKQLLGIIAHKNVRLPRFDFFSGRRTKGAIISLPKNGVALVEGIHCLNEELTHRVPRTAKFKVYVSALTQLNIDDHNRISTTDTRMMRRIVRDTYFRGYTAQGVFNHWGSVRRGEEKNIYPFQEDADEMFNSALIYEPSVLKGFCVPIIRRIKRNNPVYEEARRLFDYFNAFYDLPVRDVPSNSILREFIGSSSFIY